MAHNRHGNNKYLTAKPKVSRQYQIPHGKTKMLTAKPNSPRQNQNAHGETIKLTAKPKSSRQNQRLTAKPKSSRQNQKAHGKTKNSRRIETKKGENLKALSKEKPLESYEQTPQKLRLRITFQISKNDLLTEVTPAQTLIENLLSDIKFTEKESALL